MEQVNIYEAKARLSELVNAASEGAEIIIARNGRPMARLVPLFLRSGPWKGRGFGSMPSLGPIPEDFDEPLSAEELALFDGSSEV